MSTRDESGDAGGHDPRRQTRGNPRLEEQRHDPYRAVTKAKGPQRCSQCGATYAKGKWTWDAPEAAPATIVCPACRRIEDRYPAGEVLISGAFAAAHGDEILHLVRNIEAAESREHPLHRVMDIERAGDTVTVTTTDVHLPRRIGHALEDAWGGALATHYDEGGYFARVTWERND